MEHNPPRSDLVEDTAAGNLPPRMDPFIPTRTGPRGLLNPMLQVSTVESRFDMKYYVRAKCGLF